MFLGHHNGILKILNFKSMLSRYKTWKVCCKREFIKKLSLKRFSSPSLFGNWGRINISQEY